MNPEAYTYIAAWGRYFGSDAYYIKGQQEQAVQDNAPADALYRRDDGTWFCRHELGRGGGTVAQALDRLAGKVGGG